MKNVIADLNLYNHDNILDIGTGKGQFINDIIKIFPNHKSIIGIDPNEESIKHAKEIFHTYEKVNFLVKNTDATDFEDNSFDVITLSNTIHHLPPGNKLFKEIERLLKPNGVLFIIELYSDGDQSEKQMTHILQHHFRAEVDTKSGIFHDFTFSRQRIIDFVEEQKIVIIIPMISRIQKE